MINTLNSEELKSEFPNSVFSESTMVKSIYRFNHCTYPATTRVS